MTSRDFCYWLQGFFELSAQDGPITIEQKHIIKNHLAMVFTHEIDPSFGTKEHREQLVRDHNKETPKSDSCVYPHLDETTKKLIEAIDSTAMAKMNC
jgi:hypothetical protein